jgi:hypothetical protein
MYLSPSQNAGGVKLLSRCFYHPRTSSIITDRNLLDARTVGGLLNMLPEEERHGLKYVTICLEDGVAGDVDRDSLVAALEVFGQIRDSGVNPKDLFRGLEDKEVKLAPAVKAREVNPGPPIVRKNIVPRRGAAKPVKSRATRPASPSLRRGKRR